MNKDTHELLRMLKQVAQSCQVGGVLPDWILYCQVGYWG
jgi:hypothetical protein